MAKETSIYPWQITGAALWVRVGLYARAHHGVRLGPGQLRRDLGQTYSVCDISRAIARAKQEGMLTHDSTARAMYSLLKEAA